MRHPQEITGTPGLTSEDFVYADEPDTFLMAIMARLEAIRARQSQRVDEITTHPTIYWKTLTSVLDMREVEDIDTKGELL